MLRTQYKHYLWCLRVARLQVSLAQDVDLGVSNLLIWSKKIGAPKEDIFLTTFYGLDFSHHYTNYKLKSFTCWTSVGSFHVRTVMLQAWAF